MTSSPKDQSASERRDELAEAWADECFTGESALKRESHFSFKAGYDAAVKEMLRGNLQILGFSVEQIEQLKSFFEMQTAMKPNEFGGSLIDNLVKDNAALSKEVAELRKGAKAWCSNKSIALEADRDAWKLQAEILAKILSSINVQQIVNGLAGQELRATEITIALAEFQKFLEGERT